MDLYLTNSLTRKKEKFIPLKEGEVRMYVCGPTVYGLTHIGNARPVVFFDVVRRFLESVGYRVTYVSNFTDVDDKIISRAREEKKAWIEIANLYINEFRYDVESLKVRPPNHSPRVTEHIPEIIQFIEGLIKNGKAYAVEGEVFYSIKQFASYGKLSGKNVDELLVGARVDPNEKKKDPIDFSLWKPSKAEDEPAWNSPWGMGRPGWHIECSVMALSLLGETFDIHGGGMDLIHPHHENEIAQSEGLIGKPFVKVWLHNNFLNMGAEKMSKSLGNLFLTREFVKKNTGETLKYLLLSSHYRSPINFSEKHIRETQAGLHRVYTTLKKCASFAGTKKPRGTSPTAEEQLLIERGKAFKTFWNEAMCDDLNTAKLLGHVFEYVRGINAYLDRKGFKPTPITPLIATQFIEEIQSLSRVINLFGESPDYLHELRQTVLATRNINPIDIEKLIQERKLARLNKDFAKADKIRASLLESGIEIKDSPSGTEWDVSFT